MKIRPFIAPIVVILAAAGLMAFLMFGTDNSDPEDLRESATFTPRPAWVIADEATAHTCADPDCDLITIFEHNDSFIVIGTLNGVNWNGSGIWYETTIDDQPAFVNNSLLTFVEPTETPD